MTYRLKDRELQRKLDELSNGDFSKQLASNEKRICSSLEFLQQITLWFCKREGPLHSLEITPDMLEEVREYDPHKWNGYPEVEPPEGVLMRVECSNGLKACAKYRLFAEGGSWCDPKGVSWPKALSLSVARFRPWNEEDDECQSR